MKNILIALKMLIVMTVLTGVLYTGVATLISQIIYPRQSHGSLILKEGKTVGSSLIAQKFTSARYFWPRPSASDFKAVPSGASNLGPTSADLKKQADERSLALKSAHPTEADRAIPSDLVFASASGIDPDISPEAADYQVRRVAQARNLSEEQIREILRKQTLKRQFNFLGEPRVNVLALNLELDQLNRR